MKFLIPLFLLAGLPACPPPTPTPTPTVPPIPQTCANTECKPGFKCIETTTGPKCVIDDPTPPPPTVTTCPKKLSEGAYVYVNNKPYGQGFDSAYRVRGDKEFCKIIHGVDTNDCNIEGWENRVACELELGEGCPVWQFTTDPEEKIVSKCSDNQNASLSCDHFGDPTFRDDPKTPTTGITLATLEGFEGQPKVCGLQRDSHGPIAGFFTIAHGLGKVRACLPNGTNCGPWQNVNH